MSNKKTLTANYISTYEAVQMIVKTVSGIGILLFCFLAPSLLFAEDLPRFFGLYIMQNGNYVEIPRTPSGNGIKYNFHKSIMQFHDYNVKYSIDRKKFIEVEINEFNKNGFLVKEDKNWTDFVIYRVPHTGKYANNENNASIITNIGYGGDYMGMVYSTKALDPKVGPVKWCTLKKAKVGEDAYIYVPSKPTEKGFYLIDYKIGGNSFNGWNAIQVK